MTAYRPIADKLFLVLTRSEEQQRRDNEVAAIEKIETKKHNRNITY